MPLTCYLASAQQASTELRAEKKCEIAVEGLQDKGFECSGFKVQDGSRYRILREVGLHEYRLYGSKIRCHTVSLQGTYNPDLKILQKIPLCMFCIFASQTF